MLLKLIGKLLFKATIPLGIVAGLFSYGLYARGGDPVAMWKGFGAGAMDQMASLISNVKDDASNAAANVANVGAGDLSFGKSDSSKRTQVFTWKDADGVTHYSTIAPTDTDSRQISVNPMTNVMAPIKVSKPVEVSSMNGRENTEGSQQGDSVRNSRKEQSKRDGHSDPAVQSVADQLDGQLPGVVGQILSSQGDSAGKLDPAQLLKMLQQ